MKSKTASAESLFALGGNLVTRMGKLNLPQDRVDGIKERKDPRYWEEFDHIARGNYAQPIVVPDELILILGEWRSFYWRFFGVKLDVGSLRVPERVEGIDRPNIVAAGISINLAVKAYKDKGIPLWKWCSGDLESVMQEQEREPVAQSRFIWVYEAQEATDVSGDLNNVSADTIKQRQVETETLCEHLIHRLKYWDETGGKHLDEKSITLCAGSRFVDGLVPSVCRDDFFGDVDVYGYDSSNHVQFMRARHAVR